MSLPTVTIDVNYENDKSQVALFMSNGTTDACNFA
jgi:hypothetical protein